MWGKMLRENVHFEYLGTAGTTILTATGSMSCENRQPFFLQLYQTNVELTSTVRDRVAMLQVGFI